MLDLISEGSMNFTEIGERLSMLQHYFEDNAEE